MSPMQGFLKNRRYYETFSNYIELLNHIRSYLDSFEKKGLFMRLIRLDDYRRSLLNLARQVDSSISALRDGLSLQGAREVDLTQRLNSAQQEMHRAINRFDSMQNHVAGSEGQRDQLMTHIQLAELGTKDIIDAVEIPPRRVKSIPGDQPRQGRNFTVHRRLYDSHDVAEKLYRSSISDERNLQQIRKQVAILKKLEVCPYIIRFYGIHRKTNSFGLISEYATMGSLKELIASGDELEHRVKIGMTSGIVEGIAFLHNVGIIHKNIKTSSVLVMRDMTAKLSGFEFSREVEMETVQVVDLGSDRFRWIPPEKIRSFVNSTTMGDVYSLGMTLWSLWSGLYPYRNLLDRTSVESFVLSGGREDSTLLPSSVQSLVDQCFNDNPDARPSAADLINSLDQFFPKEMDCSESTCSSDYGHELSPTLSLSNSLSSLKLASGRPSAGYSPTGDITPTLTPRALISHSSRQPSLNSTPRRSDVHTPENATPNVEHADLQYPSLESAVQDHNQARYQEAFDKFILLRQKGVVRAEYFLGYYYFWGQEGVVEKDLTRAMDYLSRAATKSDSDALDLLGMVYRDPANPAADPTKAFDCFLQAANLGNRKGYYHLFASYAAGRGTVRDPAKAKEMLLMSARLGYPSAIQQANKLGLKAPF
ncbi:hypothetical protein DSO57_1000630 [Entomophthora muscae]|uniref:Uncharacterized protein n=1 Tax=Entomophthora muscae TaxID=34485 RepID=A0ACC2S0H5_9FUNG|nr:hypothetical protein DSO57_1000630 [Entomophthora muscae]